MNTSRPLCNARFLFFFLFYFICYIFFNFIEFNSIFLYIFFFLLLFLLSFFLKKKISLHLQFCQMKIRSPERVDARAVEVPVSGQADMGDMWMKRGAKDKCDKTKNLSHADA